MFLIDCIRCGQHPMRRTAGKGTIMRFILLKPDMFDTDTMLIKEILVRRSMIDSFEEMTIQEFRDAERKRIKDSIPIGSVQFVEAWLDKCCGISHINPIEIPECLRTEEFLKRDYRIVPFEDIPRGEYFVKDASKLKKYTFFGDTEELFTGREAGFIDRSHLFQVSEIKDILSEYRVYIFGGKVNAVCNYDGRPDIFPDMDLVERANRIYMAKPDYPKSLTIDVMVTKEGTSLIEVHPFVACGLYSTLWGDNLLAALIDGIDYVRRHNTPIRISQESRKPEGRI